MINQILKEIRLKKDLSQQEVAKALGVSRTTYINIEKGQRELTITELEKLAKFLEVDWKRLLDGNIQDYEIELKDNDNKDIEHDIRIVMDSVNVEKFKEVLLYILSEVGSKPNVGETVIYKLLYFIDFDYYEQFETQLTGATYIKNHHGPTPVEFKSLVDQMISKEEIELVQSNYYTYPQRKYLPLRKPNLKILTAEELNHINDVLDRLSDKTAKELSEYSHKDVPWIIPKQGEEIDYETVFYRGRDYSTRNYEDEI